MLYRGVDGFVAGTLPFVRQGVDAGESVLVLVPEPGIGALRVALAAAGCPDGAVSLSDMAQVGRNPARIIQVWLDFVAARGDFGPIRGVGEPIWAGRTPHEVVECQRHEALLNVAFADAGSLRILCPYDEDALAPSAIAEARHSHPWVSHGGQRSGSDRYRPYGSTGAPFDGPLPPAPTSAPRARFGAATLPAVRRAARAFATAAGLSDDRAHDLMLAANEIATNSIRHGGGTGTMRMWQEDDDVVCEIRDGGRIEEPLAGRLRPRVEQPGGRGLWLVNQLCDLVQIRSDETGSVVRLRQRLAG